MVKKNFIGIIGLGYVGLPLAVAMSAHYDVIGYDTDLDRIMELKAGYDRNTEVSASDITAASNLGFSPDITQLDKCNIYIVTVPTPVDENDQPDLSPLISATKQVCEVLSKGDLIIYESTVYPTTTREVCGSIITQETGLKMSETFFLGYSPERLSPGDPLHSVENITKLIAGCCEGSLNQVKEIYEAILPNNTYQVKSLEEAEAAKILENTQRDVNIALVNQFAKVMNKLGIDTCSVIEAASTKWNFSKYTPGLVGGHCIGVDPYYLIHKASQINVSTDLIEKARSVNASMAYYCADLLIDRIIQRKLNKHVLILGGTFKENCSDTRNSQVPKIISRLFDQGLRIDIYDPYFSKSNATNFLSANLIDQLVPASYGGILLAVPHKEFINLGPDNIRKLSTTEHIFYDLKSIFSQEQSDLRL